jgi:hypothetical protein
LRIEVPAAWPSLPELPPHKIARAPEFVNEVMTLCSHYKGDALLLSTLLKLSEGGIMPMGTAKDEKMRFSPLVSH